MAAVLGCGQDGPLLSIVGSIPLPNDVKTGLSFRGNEYAEDAVSCLFLVPLLLEYYMGQPRQFQTVSPFKVTFRKCHETKGIMQQRPSRPISVQLFPPPCMLTPLYMLACPQTSVSIPGSRS